MRYLADDCLCPTGSEARFEHAAWAGHALSLPRVASTLCLRTDEGLATLVPGTEELYHHSTRVSRHRRRARCMGAERRLERIAREANIPPVRPLSRSHEPRTAMRAPSLHRASLRAPHPSRRRSRDRRSSWGGRIAHPNNGRGEIASLVGRKRRV